MLGRDGRLYGFGARMNGQIDGINGGTRQEQCSFFEIELPNGVGKEGQKIVEIDAKNLKS